MVEAFQWIVVGLGLGVAVEWVRHGSILRSLAALPKYKSESENLEREVKGLKIEIAALREQADLVPGLKARVVELENRPVQVLETSSVESAPVVKVLGLEAVTSLPDEFRVRLEAAGIADLADLGSRSEQEILDMVEAQPWDDLDVGAWIREASELAGKSSVAVPTVVEKVAGDDLMLLPGITGDQAEALRVAGFSGFSVISGTSEEELLAAVDAQPWDMVDVAGWIEFAKGRS